MTTCETPSGSRLMSHVPRAMLLSHEILTMYFVTIKQGWRLNEREVPFISHGAPHSPPAVTAEGRSRYINSTHAGICSHIPDWRCWNISRCPSIFGCSIVGSMLPMWTHITDLAAVHIVISRDFCGTCWWTKIHWVECQIWVNQLLNWSHPCSLNP